MARRQSDNRGNVISDKPTSDGVGAGEESVEKKTPPRPADSAKPELEKDVDVLFRDSSVVNPDKNAKVAAPAPNAAVSVYPFGWSRLDLRRFVGLTITAIAFLVFLWYVQPILPPFLIAFFLAALFEPTVRDLELHGRSRVRSILTLYAAAVSLVVIVGFVAIPRVIVQSTEISSNLNAYIIDVQQSADSFLTQHRTILEKVGIKQNNVSQLMRDKAAPIQAVLSSGLSTVTSTLGGLASRALWLIIIPLTSFFFMRDYPILRARIITQFPEMYHERIDIMSREVMDVFSAYLRGLGKICTLYSVVAICLYSVLGLRYALILGLFAGIFYAVPYVGQIFTALGTGTIAYLMDTHRIFFFYKLNLPQHSVVYTLGVVVIAIVVQNIFDQLLYPRIVGGSVGLHPVASIFALAAGANLFGIWGMLIAVPVAASIQIIIMYFFPKVRMAPAPALLDGQAPSG